MTTQTTVSAPKPPKTANIYDLGLKVITEKDRPLIPGASVGDLYKVILLASGAVAYVPLTVADIEDVRDSINIDPVRAEGTYIPLTAAVRI
jgi:hypothetical protein